MKSSPPIDLKFPLKGLNIASGFESQPPGTTAGALNVRGYEPVTGSDRGGQRSGLSKYCPTQINGSLPIQDLNHLATAVGVPVTNPGDMGVPLSSGGSVKFFDATSTATGTAGSAGDTVTCVAWDGSNNAYVGLIDASANLKLLKVSRAGVVAWTTTLAASVGSTPAGVFGLAWDGSANIYALGTGASLSPVFRIWKLDAATGTISGGTPLITGASVAAIRDQGSAQPSLNVLAYCSGYLCYPSATHVVTIYKVSTAATVTYDLGNTNYGTAVTDIATDGNNYFYVNGYNSGTPHSGVAKISTGGAAAWNVQNATLAYSIVFNAAVQELGALNTTGFQTLSLLTGTQLATYAPASGSAWAVVRNAGTGGFNLYAKATSSNFLQINSGLVTAIAIKTLVGNNINAGVGVNQQTTSPTLSAVNIRALAVSGGLVKRFSSAGPVTIVNGQVLSSGVSYVFSTSLFARMYYSDGLQYVYYDAATDSMNALVASVGSLPVDSSGNCGRLLVTWRQRLVISGLQNDAANWFMSAQADPSNWKYSPSPTVETQAVAGNNSSAGVCPDVINCLLPYSDEILLMGLDHSIYQMSGDPMAGGRIDLVCDTIGMAFGQPWCRDGTGTLYFMSSRGSIYAYAPGALPQRISDPISELLVGTIDFSNTLVRMAWDERQMGFMVFVSPQAGGATYNYFYDVRNQAWWRDQLPSTMQPMAVHSLQGFTAADRNILLGGEDGYIRYLDPAALDDDGTAITSYVFLGPLKAPNSQPSLVSDLRASLGASSGNVAYSVYSGNSAEAAFNATPIFTGTFTAGRNRSQSVRSRGFAHYIKIGNPANTHTTYQIEYVKAVLKVPEGQAAGRMF